VSPVFTTISGEQLQLGVKLGEGGEGEIWSVIGHPEAAKLYHTEARSREKERKLKVMLANPPKDDLFWRHGRRSIAWPEDMVYQDGAFAGFLMPFLTGSHKILEIYNPRLRQTACPGFNWKYLMRTASNLSIAMDSVHTSGYVIGDVNEGNVLVNDGALVSLIDTDSFQVRDPNGRIYRCPVGKEDFTPPRLQGVRFNLEDRLPEDDYFGLAVMVFLLLMEGNHPFAGVIKMKPSMGSETSLPSHIFCLKQGAFPYTNNSLARPRPTAPAFKILPLSLQQLMIRAFVEGYDHPNVRPTAGEWAKALSEAEDALVMCKRDAGHFYASHPKQKTCPWCERLAAASRSGDNKPAIKQEQTPLPPVNPAVAQGTPVHAGKVSKKKLPFSHRQTGGAPQSSSIPSTPGKLSMPGLSGVSAALSGTGSPARIQPTYQPIPLSVQQQLNRYRQPIFESVRRSSGLSRSKWWIGVRPAIIWGTAIGLMLAGLIFLMFNYSQVSSVAGGILVGGVVALLVFTAARFCFARLPRHQIKFRVLVSLVAVIGGGYLIYRVGVWGARELSMILHTTVLEWGGLFLNGFALGGIGGAAVGNFRVVSRVFNRPAGLLLSLALAVPLLVLLAAAGLFDLAFKSVK
jgi:serine/threonine protein kinase